MLNRKKRLGDIMNNVSSLQKSNSKNFNLCFCFLLLTILFFSSGHFSKANAQPQTDIKLDMQITVDGLRGDLLDRYATLLAPGNRIGQVPAVHRDEVLVV